MSQSAEPGLAPSRSAGAPDPRFARTRAAVLEAVRAILLEEGWDEVTHLRVAERSGVHRGTIWRHWPERSTLLHEALAEEAVSVDVEPSGDLRQDLISSLELLRHEIVDRPMGRVLATLIDRSEWQPEIHRLKVALVRSGFPAIRQVLQNAIDRGEIQAKLNSDHAIAQLVGPIFYRRLMTAELITSKTIDAVVDDFLAAHQT